MPIKGKVETVKKVICLNHTEKDMESLTYYISGNEIKISFCKNCRSQDIEAEIEDIQKEIIKWESTQMED